MESVKACGGIVSCVRDTHRFYFYYNTLELHGQPGSSWRNTADEIKAKVAQLRVLLRQLFDSQWKQLTQN